jgi:hypothetical protein
MTDIRDSEIMTALQILDTVSLKEWLQFMKKDEDNLPYWIADIARMLNGAVWTLCPPGYEVDR